MINKIPTINFRDSNIETIIAGVNMEQVKSIVFGKFLPNIKVAVEKNKKECVFCFVKDYQVVIPKEQYKPALETLEKYYTSKEDYPNAIVARDLCAKIK